MNSAIERLLTLRVRDIMHSNVISVREDATMSQAACLLDEHDVTGAPVVNSDGKCVGVLSTSDFVYRERQAATRSESFGLDMDRMYAHPTTSSTYLDPIKENLVSEHMSPLVQTISQEAPILNAARVLCLEHIHRLVIVDSEERPTGIVSSLDFVAAMIAAIEQ